MNKLHHPEVTALLFDMDGTLADSRDVIWEATEHTLAAHGVTAPRDAYKHVIHHLDDVHSLYPDSGEIASYHATFRAFIETAEKSVVLYEGAVALLESLKKQGYKLALVTATSRAVDRATEYGIAQYFDAIVGGGDCREHKPHPEPLFVATQRMGVRAEQAIMIGDTVADVQAGKAAGVAYTIGLTHGMHDQKMLEEAGVDYTVPSLSALQGLLLGLRQSDNPSIL